jgi:hypothetical protein
MIDEQRYIIESIDGPSSQPVLYYVGDTEEESSSQFRNLCVCTYRSCAERIVNALNYVERQRANFLENLKQEIAE